MRLAFTLFAVAAAAAFAQAPAQKLEYVVVVGRHGVRAPTASNAELRQYSDGLWPDWGVAPGELTDHGRRLMTILGGWYRAWLARDGLLPEQGCGLSETVYVRADLDQRTRESGRAFAQGLFPDCPPEVHLAEGQTDGLFHSAGAGVAHLDPELARASVAGRIGANPAALAGPYAHAFETLAGVLGKPLPASLASSLEAGKDGVADIRGPLRTGSTMAENLLLEYANGFTGGALGWGRLNAAKLNEVMAIHTAYADLARRTSYLAAAQGSNLLQHILLSLDQAISGKPVRGALGNPSTRVLVLAGHDTNISHLAGMLQLSWLLPGYQRDDTPPGGALIFRLWRDTAGRGYFADVLYVAQTIEQLHSSAALTLASPPLVAPIFVPGCAPATARIDCAWQTLRRIAAGAVLAGDIEP